MAKLKAEMRIIWNSLWNMKGQLVISRRQLANNLSKQDCAEALRMKEELWARKNFSQGSVASSESKEDDDDDGYFGALDWDTTKTF